MFKKSTIFILHFAPSVHFTLSLQSAFYTQSAVRSPQSAVRSPQSAVRSLRVTEIGIGIKWHHFKIEELISWSIL